MQGARCSVSQSVYRPYSLGVVRLVDLVTMASKVPCAVFLVFQLKKMLLVIGPLTKCKV